MALTDDLGQSYAITSDVILGSALGVTGGVLTAEPYKGQGRTLSLTVTDMSVSSDGSAARTVSGAWSVTFVENTAPGTPVDYSQGSRISPGIMSAGQLKIGLPAFGSPFIKLVVDRAGQQGALYGRISNGVAQPLTETAFHRLMEAETGAPDFSYPTGWPSNLSMEQAKQVALEGAAHLLQDRPVEVQDTIIYGLMPYRRAAAQVDSERLAGPPDDALVWMIAFEGFFYPLQGPAGAGSPAQPVCSEIITLVNDASGEYFMGTIRPADFCLTP